MEPYYIIGRAATVCDGEDEENFDVAPTRARRGQPKKALAAKPHHYKYTLEEAVRCATARARNDECDYVIYQAVKLVELEKAPVAVKDIVATPTTEGAQ